MLIKGRILSFFQILFISIIFISTSACSELVKGGHYEGNLFQLQNNKAVIQPVRIDVLYPSKKHASLIIENTQGESIASLEVKKGKKKSFLVDISFLKNYGQMSFQLSPYRGCYVQNSAYHVEMCVDLNHFNITVTFINGTPILTLSGSRFNPEKEFEVELPRKLTLSEAVEIALGKNFETNLEYHKYKQAKYTAIGAFLSLTPRISLGSIIWTVGSDIASLPVGLIAGIGDFAPFLLPNRWIQAFSARKMKEAEETTLSLMRANLASQVEGLVYLYEQENRMLQIYSEVTSHLKSNHVALELQPSMDSMLDAMSLEIMNLEEAVRAAKASVALSLGYHNPGAIEALEFDDDARSVANSKELSVEENRAIALTRSFELRQIDFLKRSTKLANIANWFTLFDPQGSPDYALGAGGIALQIAGNSKLKEMMLQREFTQVTIFHQAEANIANYNKAIRAYPIAHRLKVRSEKQLHEMFKSLQKNSGLSFEVVEALVEKYLTACQKELEIITNFRISRSKVDRMLLQELYLKTLPRAEDNQEEDDVRVRNRFKAS
jgi:hypothetical protein